LGGWRRGLRGSRSIGFILRPAHRCARG
jgi:hypothetical protein